MTGTALPRNVAETARAEPSEELLLQLNRERHGGGVPRSRARTRPDNARPGSLAGRSPIQLVLAVYPRRFLRPGSFLRGSAIK